MNKQEIVDFLSQPENFMLGREVADEILAAQGFVASLWGVDDVREVANGKELTDEQCMEVLDTVMSNHDASIGINWDVIGYHYNDIFGQDDDDEEENEEAELFYFIDLDERGEFKASLRNRDDDTLLAFDDEIFEDGFMKHKEDTDGLLKYVQSLGYTATKITKSN